MKSALNKKNKLVLIAFLLMPLINFSQETAPVASSSVFTNSLFLFLLAVIIMLLFVIGGLSTAVKNFGDSDLNKKQNNNSGPTSTTLIVIFSLLALSSYSQSGNSTNHNWSVGGLDSITFYCMLSIILLELIVIAVMVGTIRTFLNAAAGPKQVADKPKEKTIFDKLNDAVDVEKEAEILMDHDYDGIKELDNNLPPWWKYGFYLTIIVAFLYLIHYHVAKTGNLQAQEYAEEIKAAEISIAEFMRNSANNVDESTVKILTTEADLKSGKDLFISTCAACHGKLGEGGVGPNLTDDYWVHGGGIKDLFKTVKYGWPDKGMKSWKEDLSPMQMAQVTSFIKTLRGSNPPNGKEKQGDLYDVEEETPVNDSTVVHNDSLKVILKADSLKK